MTARAPTGGAVAALALAACGIAIPTPRAEIPVGGERASILPADLAATRDGMSGGLVEPSWLPNGFELVFVFFGGGLEQSAELRYEDDDRYVQISQAHRGPAVLGPKEPFDYGERAPLGDTVEWTTAPLGDLDPGGRIYDATMPDGRTVSVASNLDPGAIERVLSSLYVHAGTDDR